MYPTIKIYVEGGAVMEVDNLPDGFDYEVIDRDVLEIEDIEQEEVIKESPLSDMEAIQEIEKDDKYTLDDYLDFANGFDYSQDIKDGNIKGYKSDKEIKESMKSWSLKDFENHFGIRYKNQN